MKKVLLTGLTGQDGSYMAEHLLGMENVLVFGMVRRTAQIHDQNFRHLRDHPRLKIVRGDLLDSVSLNALVQEIQPDYFINFAAQSFVGDSWKIPEETFMASAVGVLKCLEAVRKYAPACRFYNAGSSEQFGDVIYSPQDANHPFRPRSPYGAAKCAAHHLVKVYRESYNLYAIQGMLFNHESERRGEEFVTRKITKGFARIASAARDGKPIEPIRLGNIDSKRDWSHASDFVDAIWRMLNQDLYRQEIKDVMYKQGSILLPFAIERKNIESMAPLLKEYVVASGETHTVRDFINICIDYIGCEAEWRGHKENEQLILNKNVPLVVIDPEFYRPADVNLLLGNPAEICKDLEWKPKISFDKMVKRMLECDLNESGIIVSTVGSVPETAPQAPSAS